MKIHFNLLWLKPGIPPQKAFKDSSAHTLFAGYILRISKFSSCLVSGRLKKPLNPGHGIKVVACDRSPKAPMLSSEELAKLLIRFQNEGIKELHILIGGPDGFSKQDLQDALPDFLWSFGPMTLPHELAAIVAAEQIYRAWTILRHLPYHTSH